jgi:glycosyltransferase involved in cell wall biosynthesis
MFKLCYMIDSFYAGGAEKYIDLIINGLDREVFEPSAVVRDTSALDAWCEHLLSIGVRVERLPMNLPFRPQDGWPIVRTLMEISPHLIHVNMPGPYDGQMGLLAPLARLAGASAVIVTEHLPMVERLWKRALVKRLAYLWVERVLTICHANVPYLTEQQGVPGHKVAVIHNALPHAFGTRQRAAREPLRNTLGLEPASVGIVVVGSLIRRKGLDTLIEALAGLAGAPWRLFVLGSGEDEAFFEARAEAAGIGDRVMFAGHVSADAVERILGAMDLLVMPSIMEGMPYAILEAMAAALPVIASGIHGIPETVRDGETALLVPPCDVGALRSALDRLIGDAGLRNEMGKNGRTRFESLFVLDQHMAHIQAIYLQSLQGRT